MLGAALAPGDTGPGVSAEAVPEMLAGEVFSLTCCAAQAQSVKRSIPGKKNLHLFILYPLLAMNCGYIAACCRGCAKGRVLP